MVCQEVCKQGGNDVKVKVKIQRDLSPHLFTLQLHSSVEKMLGLGFVYLPSLLHHPYLVCTLFVMPSLHLSTFRFFTIK